MLDFFRGAAIVLAVCVVAWAIWWVWQQGRLRMMRHRAALLHDADHERRPTQPGRRPTRDRRRPPRA
jgi:ABC-type nickel/cobalt efflux system permease component RcnA